MPKKLKNNFLIFLFISTILVWIAVFQQIPNNILEVNFFDVGQGDSIFIEFNDKQILIDGGPDNVILEKLGQEMSFNDRTIDLVILTHPDADHITGLIKVLENFEIKGIISSGFEKDTIVYQKWRELIENKNIPLIIAQAGQIINLDKEIEMKILWPDQVMKNNKANNSSVVIQLIYHQAEFLLTGDIEKEVERYLINNNLESDVLKVPHHGAKTSSSFDFIKAINPKISVISVGENNRYGHPDESVLERLKQSLIFRTDKDGDIEISTDGQELKVTLE